MAPLHPTSPSWLCLLLAFFLLGCREEPPSSGETGQQAEEGTPISSTPDNNDDFSSSEVSEAFQDAALGQLSLIVHSLEDSRQVPDSPADLARLVANPETAIRGALRPSNDSATVVYDQDGVTIRRWGADSGLNDKPTSLQEAYAHLASSWPSDAEPRLKVKHFGVQRLPDGTVETHTDFLAYLADSGSSLDHQAQWACRWQPGEGDNPPRLLNIRLTKLQELQSTRGADNSAFKDITEATLGALPCYRDNLRFGANHWITRLPKLKHRFHHGLAIGDVDGNGIEDVYLCQPEGLPNILLLREADGSVRDGAAEFGLDFKDNTTCALLADFDNDGDQDLALALRNALHLMENTGQAFKSRQSRTEQVQLFSLAAADYDEDGLLDLYTCRYQALDHQGFSPNPIPLHDAANGGGNFLLRNNGDWTFVDVTKQCGLDQNNDRWTMAASWEDFDLDGDLDLYVANDYGRNNLYRCDRTADGSPHFVDIAPEAGVEDMTTGMGVSWADPNRDGRPDIYVSNMYSTAGRRVAYQKNFKRNVAGSDERHVAAWQKAAMGNSFFQSKPDNTFLDASTTAGIYKGLWAWGTVFADINHDGWEDLWVANGFITGPGQGPDL